MIVSDKPSTAIAHTPMSVPTEASSVSGSILPTSKPAPVELPRVWLAAETLGRLARLWLEAKRAVALAEVELSVFRTAPQMPAAVVDGA